MPQEVDVGSRAIRVLLVDDEPQVRKFLATLLERAGTFHVMTASSGEEALDLSRNHPEEIDILITDFDMGGMNGGELYRCIRDERPETAVLFVSANPDCIRESLPECPVLEKPFQFRHFSEKLVELLSRSHLSNFRVSA